MKNSVLLLMTLVFLTTACAKKNDSNTIPKTNDSTSNKTAARILGYFMSDGNWYNEINTIDLSKLTDLNLAFVNPDAAGSFAAYNTGNLRKVVDLAHAQHVRIYFAIGGGSPAASFEHLLSAGNRTAFIQNITNLATTLNFDGVDADLEGGLIVNDTARYAAFISELQTALKAKSKLLSSAQVKWSSSSNYISGTTLNKFDYINIMSYDSTGPWNISRPGQHSSYAMAVSDFQFYLSRGIPASKLFLGVPFYGYAFGQGYVANDPDATFTYQALVNTYPGAENNDTLVIKDKGTVYYNGLPTIKKKADYAKANGAAGIMIWELHQDLPASNAKSLLNAIYNELQ